MDVMTRDYGIIPVEETSIIRFDAGILGFEEFHNYVMLDDGGKSPFRCLQSIEESSLAFVLVDPFELRPDYEFSVDDEFAKSLAITDMGDMVVLSIAVMAEDVKKSTVNLKAPLVINARVRKGAQFVVDSDEYKVRHVIVEEIERASKSAQTSA